MTHKNIALNRRAFIQSSLAAGMSIPLLSGAIASESSTIDDSPIDTKHKNNSEAPDIDPLLANIDKAAKSLDILILGGTSFIGPHIVNAAIARGHSITLFNRGKTNTHLFPQLEKLHGNRDPKIGKGLTELENRSWDAVIDTSSYVPRLAHASATLLADATKQYIMISSVSAYRDFSKHNITESAPLATMKDEAFEKVNAMTYGPLKVLCEKTIQKILPDKTTIIRPGLIVGPRDQTDRFTYWPVRIDRGGEVLSPGAMSDPVQYIDARDLARWLIYLVEDKVTGVFNAVGPEGKTNIAELLYGCKAVTTSNTTFTWVDAAFLAKKQIAPWQHMPVWIPSDSKLAGLETVSNAAAINAGLSMRSLAQIARDTLDWFYTLPEDRQNNMRSGITNEREVEILKAWYEANN